MACTPLGYYFFWLNNNNKSIEIVQAFLTFKLIKIPGTALI